MCSTWLAIVYLVKRSRFSFLVFWNTCDIVVNSSRSLSHLLMSSCYILRCLMHLRNWWSQFRNLMHKLDVQVTAYGWETIPDSGMIRWCNPSKIWGALIISLERLNLKSSNLVGCINSSNMMIYYQQKSRGYGHVTFLKFCRLSWCSVSHWFVSDSWATCS